MTAAALGLTLILITFVATLGAANSAASTESRDLRDRIEVLEGCCEDMSPIYRELAEVIDRNGQTEGQILRKTVTSANDLTNVIIENDATAKETDQ